MNWGKDLGSYSLVPGYKNISYFFRFLPSCYTILLDNLMFHSNFIHISITVPSKIHSKDHSSVPPKLQGPYSNF